MGERPTVEPCWNCGELPFITETHCNRCKSSLAGPPPPPVPQPHQQSPGTSDGSDDGSPLAAVTEWAKARPVAFGIGFVVLVVLLGTAAAFVSRGDAGSKGPTWGPQATPLGQAMVDLPDDCRVTPPRESAGGRMGALDCWLTSNGEIAVLEAQLADPHADGKAAGVAMVEQMIGGKVGQVTAGSDSSTFTIDATGAVAKRPATLSGRLVLDGKGGVLVVVGIGVDKVPVPPQLARVLHSLHAA